MVRGRDRGLDPTFAIVLVTFPVPENLGKKEAQHLALKIQQLNMYNHF